MLGADYDELLQAWSEAEPVLARLAALNPDRCKVEVSLAPFLDDGRTWAVREGLRFHDVVAELADSPVLALMLKSLRFIAEQVLTSPERHELETGIVPNHREVAEAIIAGEPEAAAQRMRGYIERVVADFKAFWPQRIGEKIQWR